MNLVDQLYQQMTQSGIWEKDLTLKRKEYLKVGGTIDTNIYFIKSGSLKIFIISEYEEHIIRFGYKHNIIASLDSFITGKPSDLYMQAIKKTELEVTSKSTFLEFIRGNEERKALWDRIIESLILQQMERERDILTTSPKERFKRVFKRSPQLFQEVPNKYIASYLRMTPETLSRLKKS